VYIIVFVTLLNRLQLDLYLLICVVTEEKY